MRCSGTVLITWFLLLAGLGSQVNPQQSAGQDSGVHPDWIPTRPDNDDRQIRETELSPTAQAVLYEQALSATAVHQLDAIHGIQELIQAGSVSRNDPGVVEILYLIAAQSFTRTIQPEEQDPLHVRLPAIRALGDAGAPARAHLLRILKHDPNPTAAAEAAFALRGLELTEPEQRQLADGLRRARTGRTNDRLAYAVMYIAYEQARAGPIEHELVDEILLTYSGPFIYEVRSLAGRTLRLLREW